MMCATGRCMLRLGLRRASCWTRSPGTTGRRGSSGSRCSARPRGGYLVSADLRRENERLALSAPLMLVAGGFVFTADRVARLADGGLFPWISVWRASGDLSLPAGKAQEWLGEVLSLPAVPRLELPPDLAYEETAAVPRPRLLVRAAKTHYGEERLGCHLSFDYDGAIVPATQPGRGVFQPDRRRLVLRDPVAERTHAERLPRLGIRRPPEYVASAIGARLVIAPGRLSRAVAALLAEGWQVEAEGKLYRQRRRLPARGRHRHRLVRAARRGRLRRPTRRRCPSCWPPCAAARTSCGSATAPSACCPRSGCSKYGLLAGLGTAERADLRFTPQRRPACSTRLLAAQPEVDAATRPSRGPARSCAASRASRRPTRPPGFDGHAARLPARGPRLARTSSQRFGFGGCLADDMGLGKTVQVLALLESRRELPPRRPTSGRPVAGRRAALAGLQLEAGGRALHARSCACSTTPAPGRHRAGEHFADYDLVLTTYGTLRRDVAAPRRDSTSTTSSSTRPRRSRTPTAESAKAARLLRGRPPPGPQRHADREPPRRAVDPLRVPQPRHARARASVFQDAAPAAAQPRRGHARSCWPGRCGRSSSAAPRSRSRTDLPAQDRADALLRAGGRRSGKLYDELRDHYRAVAARPRSSATGWPRSKIQVLEALLRLRQAACHPGLIDTKRAGEPSAKLDVLLPQLAEVVEEGHKALVFSQFTSFLAIVRDRLDAAKASSTSTSTARRATAQRGSSASRPTPTARCS